MAGYSRKTALSPREVLEHADEILPEYIGVAKTKATSHAATFTGSEGTVSLSMHSHGAYTEVVATTDRLRTSRMDYEIQKFLNRLPYEPGDAGGPGAGEPRPD